MKGSSLKMSRRTYIGFQEMSFYSTYRDCRCYGACNCEKGCVWGGQFPVRGGGSLIDRMR